MERLRSAHDWSSPHNAPHRWDAMGVAVRRPARPDGTRLIVRRASGAAAGSDGIPMLAPGVAGGFDPTQFEALAEIEDESFWFKARNRIVLWALATWCADAKNLLEVGCGTGHVLHTIAKALPAVELHAVDLHVEGLTYARRRV